MSEDVGHWLSFPCRFCCPLASPRKTVGEKIKHCKKKMTLKKKKKQKHARSNKVKVGLVNCKIKKKKEKRKWRKMWPMSLDHNHSFLLVLLCGCLKYWHLSVVGKIIADHWSNLDWTLLALIKIKHCLLVRFSLNFCTPMKRQMVSESNFMQLRNS